MHACNQVQVPSTNSLSLKDAGCIKDVVQNTKLHSEFTNQQCQKLRIETNTKQYHNFKSQNT
jgi:hypothetical protein